ncbi:MAG TPA: 2-hydroxyacyl-CoA dehydratase family protein [Thermodesulfobacteriota bacterium]|nr:2-hydroxyacyl-CoA dehydratase family protein [Thermodesulfobacteriota bacterium]
MNHLEEYRQAVSDPADYARQLKKVSGEKIIGYTCSYTPEEIIMAAGAHPMRLFGTKQHISMADFHLQSYCCSVAPPAGRRTGTG